MQEVILLCAMDVAVGMRYLHSVGVVHADLKPANVLLKTATKICSDPRGFTCKVQTLSTVLAHVACSHGISFGAQGLE